MKKIFLATISLISVFYSFGQKIGIDGKGKSIFTHISRSEARFEFSTEEPLSISYLFNPKISTFSLTQTGDTTVTKFSGLLGQISMLNSGDYLALSNLSKLRPGVGFEIGYQKSIERFRNIDIIPSSYGGTYTAGIKGLFNIDNIKLYNTDNSKIESKLPLTYGLEANYNFFFKNMNRQSINRIVFALNLSLLRTWNDDQLISYQKISDVTILPTVVALEEFDGRYGRLNNEVTNLRISISLPMYFGILNPIPYVSFYSITNQNPQYRMGVFTNILNKGLTKENFKIPASIGIGIETMNTDGKFANPVILLKGAISLGEL